MFEKFWAIENDLAACHSTSNRNGPIHYNLESIELTIENIKKNRSSYATEEYYIKELKYFERGRILLLNHINSKAEPAGN